MECVPVERLAAAVTVISLTLAPVIYFVKRMHSDKAEKQRASTALHMELEDTLDGLDPTKHQNLRTVAIQGHAVYFMSRMLNHDIYDSLVNSGKITFIDVELQQRVQDVYQRLKDHNMALKKVREMEENSADFDRAHHLYLKLEDSEYKLVASIPAVIRKLEKHSMQDRKKRRR